MIPTLGFTSASTFPSNIKTEQGNKEKLTLIPSLRCKEAFKPKITWITTLSPRLFGSGTVHRILARRIHKFDDEIEGNEERKG